LVVTVAVTMGLWLVRSSLVGIGVMGVILVILTLVSSPMTSLGVVIITCGLFSYSPFKTGVLSRLYPGNVAIGLLLALWVVRCRSRKHLFKPDLVNAPLFSLAVVMVLSMVWARLFPDPSVDYLFPHSDVSWTTTQITQLGLLVATICTPFAVAAAIRTWKEMETVILTVGVVVGLGTVLTILALVFGFGSSYSILGFRRAYWEQPWHTSVQALAAVLLPFLYSAVVFGRRAIARYRATRLLFVLSLVGVVVTFSRESWVLAAMGLLMVTALRLRKSFIKVFAISAMAFLLLAVSARGVVNPVTRFYTPDDVYGYDRVYLYMSGLQLFETHLLLGVGAGNYQFFDRAYPIVEASGQSHNQFLTLAAETGIFGISMLLWLLVRLLGIRRRLGLEKSWQKDPHYWVKAGGSVFLLLLPVQFLFGEALFVSAAEGGGTLPITQVVFNWALIGVVFAAFALSQRVPLPQVGSAAAPNQCG